MEETDLIRGGGPGMQSGIQYHGVLSDDILYRRIWDLSGSGGDADAGNKVYRRTDGYRHGDPGGQDPHKMGTGQALFPDRRSSLCHIYRHDVFCAGSAYDMKDCLGLCYILSALYSLYSGEHSA